MSTVDYEIAYCGLICSLCSPGGECNCRSENRCEKQLSPEGCYQYDCCRGKGVDGCWECEEAPCGMDMLAPERIRLRAFIRCMKEDGADTVLGYIKDNQKKGILYHRNGFLGDYDECGSEQEVIDLLRNGRLDS